MLMLPGWFITLVFASDYCDLSTWRFNLKYTLSYNNEFISVRVRCRT